MKHFTQAWWASGCDDAATVSANYEAYLASVRSRLPPELVALQTEHTLHDSEIKSINCEFAARTVVMILHGWNQKLAYRVGYTLTFTGVSSFHQGLPQRENVERELGDLGYWECELVEPNIEVRMLFESDAEFRIVFTGFVFEHHRREP